jgi:hypothetical protein
VDGDVSLLLYADPAFRLEPCRTMANIHALITLIHYILGSVLALRSTAISTWLVRCAKRPCHAICRRHGDTVLRLSGGDALGERRNETESTLHSRCIDVAG